MKERIMVIGKGAREHALAYRLSKNAHNETIRDVLVCPGNDGIAPLHACMRPSVEGFEGFLALAKLLRPDLIVIGAEEPLAEGLSDDLRAHGFSVFGPSQKAARIESSKAFMKDVATCAGIPTGAYATFESAKKAQSYVQNARYPLVIKADGLCAGKGVVIAHDMAEASAAIAKLLPLGKLVIEAFLPGEEMSVIALCSGKEARLFAPVRDHKRLHDNNQGPNTGGMGVVGPLKEARDAAFMRRLRTQFFEPALAELEKRGCPFYGALFAGLMVNNDEVHLLEFNARFGDPETQTLMYGSKVDVYPLMLAVAKEEGLARFAEDALWPMAPTATVTVAANGYPEAPRAGDLIAITPFAEDDGMVFFAGTARNRHGQLTTNGGRIVSCTAKSDSLKVAIRKSYDIVSHISFEGAHYRRDIGQSLIEET